MIALHLFIVALLFVFSCIKFKNRLRVAIVLNPFAIITFLYFVSGVASLFVTNKYIPEFNFEAHESYNYLYYTIAIFLSLIPCLLYKEFRLVPSINLLGIKLLYLFSPVIWFSLIYQVPFALKAIAVGAVDVRLNLNSVSEGVLPSGILTTVSTVTSSLFVFFTFLFYILIMDKRSKYLIITCFIGSFLYVVSSLNFMARDGVIFFVLAHMFCFLVVRGNLERNVVKKLKKVITITSLLCVFILITITLQRFLSSSSDNQRLLNGTVGYIGQQPYVFAETIQRRTEFYGLNLRFPLFADGEEIHRTEVYEWTFGTFLTDFYNIDGYSSFIAVVLFVFFLFSMVFIFRYKMPIIIPILLGVFYFHFMTTGVFYFRLGTRGGNFYFLLLIIIILLSPFLFKGCSDEKSNKG